MTSPMELPIKQFTFSGTTSSAGAIYVPLPDDATVVLGITINTAKANFVSTSSNSREMQIRVYGINGGYPTISSGDNISGTAYYI